MGRRPRHPKPAPTPGERRRLGRLRLRLLLRLDQRVGREKAVLRKTIEALARRLR